MNTVLAPTETDASSERMAAAGLRAFVRIADAWGLSVDEQLALLGQPPRSTFFAWRKHPERAANRMSAVVAPVMVVTRFMIAPVSDCAPPGRSARAH
jgi:hypothetical protein